MTAGLATAPLARSITPSGVLVSTAEPDTAEWFQVRRDGITATDIAKILDLSQHGNALSVWMDKRGDTVDLGTHEAARWGQILEEPIAQEWAARNGASVRPVGVIANAVHGWQRASLDRLVQDCPDGDGPCALEVKTRSAFLAGKWKLSVPDDVLAQTTWQMHVTGLDHIHVAALIGGQRLREFRVDREPQVEALILREAERVWADVLGGFEPETDPTAVLLKILNVLNPDRDGDAEIPAAEGDALAAAYSAAQVAVRSAEQQKEAAKTAVVAALGSAERLTAGGTVLFTYREQDKHSINVADLEANDPALYLEVLSGGHITTTRNRVLRAAKGALDG